MQPVVRALQDAGCRVTQQGIVGGIPHGMTDIVLLLGDRLDSLQVALYATKVQIPIAHIHGGETTAGSFDNQIRDAITKLSHIHFVSNKHHRWVLNQKLDEAGERIHIVGAPGLDNLVDMPQRKPTMTFICTYHPCTAIEEDVAPLLKALDSFPGYEQIWTGVNNDPGSQSIRAALGDRHTHTYSARGYLEACRQAACVVGNSSSGIIEAPSLGVPTVNVGQRQAGRLSGPSVLGTSMIKDAIVHTIKTALAYRGPFDNPYGPPGASTKIAEVLSTIDLEGIRVK